MYLGKDEIRIEKFLSVLAQLEYTHQVNDWHSKGVPFKDHLYVPEVHPLTGVEFCEREDEGHVFKVFSFFSNVTLCPFLIFSVLLKALDKAVPWHIAREICGGAA